MAYIESEITYVYWVVCEDCGYESCEYDYKSIAEEAVEAHELECSEANEDHDLRTEREKFQDTMDALAKSILIQNG